MEISIKDLMRQARESLSGRWGLAIGAFAVYLLVMVASEVLDYVTSFYLGSIILFFIIGALYLGMVTFYLAIARNEKTEVGVIFSGFQNYLKAFGLMLLMTILIVIGMFLLIVPGIILALMFGLAFYILADNPNIGVVEALKKSKAMMYGYKLKLFLLSLCFLGLVILSALTLFIGLFWLVPFMYVTYAKFYETVKANYVEEGR